MNTANPVLGIILILILSILAAFIIAVAAGFVRDFVLRINGLFRLQRLGRPPIRSYLTTMLQLSKRGSILKMLRMTFYNPWGGMAFLFILMPTAMVACSIAAVAQGLVMRLLHVQ